MLIYELGRSRVERKKMGTYLVKGFSLWSEQEIREGNSGKMKGEIKLNME